MAREHGKRLHAELHSGGSEVAWRSLMFGKGKQDWDHIQTQAQGFSSHPHARRVEWGSHTGGLEASVELMTFLWLKNV